VNKRRLTKLADYLDSLPARKFDLDHWVEKYDKDFPREDGKKHKCGTTACALGHAGLIPSFRRAGLRTIMPEGWNRGKVELDGLESGMAAAKLFFNLPEEEANYLFMPESYGVRQGPKTVAKRIRRLIKAGGLPKSYIASN
jgi:hypothetical protein